MNGRVRIDYQATAGACTLGEMDDGARARAAVDVLLDRADVTAVRVTKLDPW